MGESNERTPGPWRYFGLWFGVFAAALLLYALTADRYAQWQDSGWQQLRVVTGVIRHPFGLALYHPLQYFLGRLMLRIPGLEPALAVTLVSCLASAVAVANIAIVIARLTRSSLATLVGAAAFALSHTFWQNATHTESYGLVLALLSAEWLCIAVYAQNRRWVLLPVLALLNGLGVANHMLAALATPVDVVIILAGVRRHRRGVLLALAAALAWAAGTLPYSMYVWATYLGSGDLAGTLRSALFGDFERNVLNTHVSLRTLLLSIGYIVYNFPGLTLPLSIYGIMRRSAIPGLLARVLLVELVLYLLFVIRYSILDQYTFFVPVYAILAVFAGVGLHQALLRARTRWRHALAAAAVVTACWTPLVYPAAAVTLRRWGLLRGLVGNRPYRDGYRAFLVPWGVGDDHVEALHRDLLRLADGSGFVVLGAKMARFAIAYDQHMGRLPDGLQVVTIHLLLSEYTPGQRWQRLFGMLKQGRPVVQVPYDRDHPEPIVPGAVWERHGDVYVLKSLPEKRPE